MIKAIAKRLKKLGVDADTTARMDARIAMIEAKIPTTSDGRVPHASSASTDRPRSSVPSQKSNSLLGGRRSRHDGQAPANSPSKDSVYGTAAACDHAWMKTVGEIEYLLAVLHDVVARTVHVRDFNDLDLADQDRIGRAGGVSPGRACHLGG